MKRAYLPYYVSRAVLSAALSLLLLGLTWKAVALAAILFALFLLYLHSGWFTVDLSTPFFPLRRDERAREAQREALIAAVVAGVLVLVATSMFTTSLASAAAPLAFSLAVLAYFASQFVLLART